jgi:hypothetical protein
VNVANWADKAADAVALARHAVFASLGETFSNGNSRLGRSLILSRSAEQLADDSLLLYLAASPREWAGDREQSGQSAIKRSDTSFEASDDADNCLLVAVNEVRREILQKNGRLRQIVLDSDRTSAE